MTATAADLNAALEAVTGASLPYLDMLVTFDDGRRMTSHADQRDMRRAQVALGTDPELDPLGFNRACAWSWLTRTGELEMSWADFDAQVSFVIPLEEPTTADPTAPASAG